MPIITMCNHVDIQVDPEDFNLPIVLQYQWMKQQQLIYNLPFLKYKNSKGVRTPSSKVDRMYRCLFEGCTKAYGSISHLNTHRKRKEHGMPLSKHDFTKRQQILTNTIEKV